MKSKFFIYFMCCLGLVSCNDYLDKQPDDMQTIEGVFEKRSSTEQYLANVLSYLPHQWDNLCMQTYSTYGWPFTPASDEAEWGAVRAMPSCKMDRIQQLLLQSISGHHYIEAFERVMSFGSMWVSVQNYRKMK